MRVGGPVEPEGPLSRALSVRFRLLLAKGVPICEVDTSRFPAEPRRAPSLLLVGTREAFPRPQ